MAEEEERFSRRPLWGVLFSVLPIVSIIVVGSAYAALFWAGAEGRPADGPVQRVRFGACPEAGPVLQGRVADMGLGEVTWSAASGEIVLEARFPGDAAVANGIPTTLAKPGVLTVHDDADPSKIIATNADVDSALPYLGFRAAPATLVQLKRDPAKRLREHMEANFHDAIAVSVDGEVVLRRKNMPSEPAGQLMIESLDASDPQVVAVAAERSIVLNHGPLPCPVQVLGVETIPGR
jgi:hypothetical protein